MRVLITGGAGFVGSHLADMLLEQGDEVFALDNLSTGSIENIEHLKHHSRFRYTIDSVDNEPVLAELIDRADAVVHLAAAVGVFALAAIAFRFRVLGGGDVKLLAAGTLWLGAAALGPYLVITVLAGGAMAVVFVFGHLVKPISMRGHRPSLPYAVAIAAGGILTTAGALWT